MQRSDFLLVVSDEDIYPVARVPSSHSASRAAELRYEANKKGIIDSVGDIGSVGKTLTAMKLSTRTRFLVGVLDRIAENYPSDYACQLQQLKGPPPEVSRAPDPEVAVEPPPSQEVKQETPQNAVPTWTTQIVAQLERYKRYPPEAQSRGEQGVAQVFFTLDRQGRVLESRVLQSSGSAALDAEALALLQRAQPFPTPPAELGGERVRLTVPIRFDLH
jgi:TonB family protein